MQLNKLFNHSAILLCAVLMLSSCQKESTAVDYTANEYEELSKSLNLPGELHNYTVDVPAHINISSFSPIAPIQLNKANHTATLGRVLFYDELLSRNGTVSCGSCHVQTAGFAHNEALSEGFDGQTGTRNSLALGTTAMGLTTSYGGSTEGEALAGFSWDDSVHSMEEQTQAAIENPSEMGMTMEDMVDRVKSIAYYDILFRKAFGENEINEENLLNAITQFVNAISSNESRFDEGMNQTLNVNEDFANYTASENLGKTLYNTNCASCHGAKHDFTVKAVANNGLDQVYTDQGKGAKTGNSSDMAIFKVPFLRNIGLSGPYMHDGRFGSLEEVVDFYSENVKEHLNLSPELRESNGQVKKMNFTEVQKTALVAYMETLTDQEMIKDEKFSIPFGE
tara:strand:- start:2833 stop:4017 length:1185 start_codon:yes stop_codon:yes gene_type:complete